MMTCSATLRHNAGEAAIVGAGMSAFGRGTVRTVLLSGLSAVAIACAASFAFADPFLSPETPLSFGEIPNASPLVVVFTAARGARDPALDVALSAEPKFDLALGAER